MDVKEMCKSLEQLNTTAREACLLFLERCKEKKIDIFITETYRSQERQDYLYSLGRTQKGSIVTWTRTSRHTSRMAWDIACLGANLYDSEILKKAGQVAKELGITWGGDWDNPDMPHFEVNEYYVAKKEEDEMAEKRYMTVSDLPQWAKSTIENLIKEGKIADEKNLNLSEDMVRILVIMMR